MLMGNKGTGIPQRINECPDDIHLNKYVRGKVCAAGANKWRDLGIVLMGQDAVTDLDVIRTNHPNDVEECSLRTFTKWRQRTPKASWKQLIEALKEVELIQLASDLEELLIPSVECSVEQESEVPQQHLEMQQLSPEVVGTSTSAVAACEKLTNIQHIDIQFGKMTNRIKEALISNNVDVVPLIEQLCAISAVKRKNVPLFDKDVFKKIKSIQDFWRELRIYWNIFDYELLQIVIEISSCRQAQVILEDFLSRIDPSAIEDADLVLYCKKECWEGSLRPELRIKVKAEKCTSDIKSTVEKIVSKTYDLEKYALRFQGIKEGCIELLYYVSRPLKLHLLRFEISREIILGEFLAHKIISLQIDEFELLNTTFSTSERPDSVEADVLPPHSATSQRSIQSLRDKCYSSTIKDDTNDSISDKQAMTDSGLGGESSSSTAASKAVYTDNNSICLSHDEGISRGSSGWSKSDTQSPALYSRHGVPTKPHIKPPPIYSGYCDTSHDITMASMQIMVSEFTNRVFPKHYVTSFTHHKFDQRVSQLYDALDKKIYDIRNRITATPLDAVTRPVTFTPGGASLLSCTLPPTPDDSLECCTPEEASGTPEEASGTSEEIVHMMLPNKPALVYVHMDSKLLMPQHWNDINMYMSSSGTHEQKEYNSIEVTKDQDFFLVLNSLQQKSYLHMMVESTETGNYLFITYDLANNDQTNVFHRSSQELNPENKTVLRTDSCKAFIFNNTFSILIGKGGYSGTWRTNLYSLDSEGQFATWKLVSNFTPSFSALLLDFPNSFVVSYKFDGIILASIVNNRIIFHMFSRSIYGNNKSSAPFTLPKLHSRDAKFIMQSCIVSSNYIYCGLLQLGVSACIYRFRLVKNQKNTTIQHVGTWHISDHSNLQNCFISVHNAEVFISCCKVTDNKTTVEVKRLNSNLTTESMGSFQFPTIVKISTVSVAPYKNLMIAVIYQDIKTKKCYIKKIEM